MLICTCQDPGDNPGCAFHFPRTPSCPGCADRDARIAKLKEALTKVRELICEGSMQCNHPVDWETEDGEECENIDDCMFHSILQPIDAALADPIAKGEIMTDELFEFKMYSRASTLQEGHRALISVFRNADGTLNRQRMLDVPAMRDEFSAEERAALLATEADCGRDLLQEWKPNNGRA
jgi:hypothetical protein